MFGSVHFNDDVTDAIEKKSQAIEEIARRPEFAIATGRRHQAAV
jgi:hypothetical protein